MTASRRRSWRFLLVVGVALMFAACSASPVKQHDPSPTTQDSTAPVNYRQLGESIEELRDRLAVELDDAETRVVRRTTTLAVRNIKGNRHKRFPQFAKPGVASAGGALSCIA